MMVDCGTFSCVPGLHVGQIILHGKLDMGKDLAWLHLLKLLLVLVLLPFGHVPL
jgi:hypothetical protein